MNEPSILQVCVLGVGIVFFGLICIVLLCYLIGALSKLLDKPKNKLASPTDAPQKVETDEIPNRQEFVAAVSVAIAEHMGRDISGIRIISIKKV